MSAEIDTHITKKYEIKKRLGKGVSNWLLSLRFCAMRAMFHRKLSICGVFALTKFHDVFRLMESSGKLSIDEREKSLPSKRFLTLLETKLTLRYVLYINFAA